MLEARYRQLHGLPHGPLPYGSQAFKAWWNHEGGLWWVKVAGRLHQNGSISKPGNPAGLHLEHCSFWFPGSALASAWWQPANLRCSVTYSTGLIPVLFPVCREHLPRLTALSKLDTFWSKWTAANPVCQRRPQLQLRLITDKLRNVHENTLALVACGYLEGALMRDCAQDGLLL